MDNYCTKFFEKRKKIIRKVFKSMLYKRNKNIVIEQVDQEYILFDTENNTLFVLNRTAYELWNMFETSSRKDTIKRFIDGLDVLSIKEVGLDRIQLECNQIIDDFIERGLLKK